MRLTKPLARPDDAPGRGARVRPIAQHPDPVDPHVADAGGQLVWRLEGRPVGNRRRVEHHHIREAPRLQQPALAQPEPVGDRRSHLSHGILKRQRALLADVAPQHARVGAVRARVDRAERRGPSRVVPAGVGRNLDPRQAELHTHVGLVHREEDRADALALGREQVERGVDPVLPAQLRDRVQTHTDVTLVLGPAEANRHDPGRRGVVAHRLPIAGWMWHLGADLRAHGRVGEIVVQPAIRVGPWRQDRARS